MFKGLLLGIAMIPTLVIAAEKPVGSWQAKMSELSGALSSTIPYLYPDPGQDPKGLTAKVKNLYDITKDLDGALTHSASVPDQDPALPYIAGLFRQDIERAYTSLQEGHADYAKGVIRSSVSYCIACHTRTQSGLEFPLLKAFEQPLKRASWIEKIEFQAASRQFDQVLSEVMAKLKSPGLVGISSLDLERGARIALSVAVRVKQDPDRAIFLAKAVSESPSANLSMKEAAKEWQKDIREWQSERAKKLNSDRAMIEQTKLLLKRGQTATSSTGGHSDVRYLRASVIMHDFLRQYPNSSFTPEALYLTGLTYDALRDIGLWSMHEMYFLACIDKAPHTQLSAQCFKEYEQSITLGYTGSRGTNIPAAVRKYLASVKLKAEPKPVQK